MGEGGEVAELQVGVAFDAEVFADGREEFGLFDGVDAEVGFEVEVGVEHVGRVAGLVGDQCQHGRVDVLGFGCEDRRLSDGLGRGLDINRGCVRHVGVDDARRRFQTSTRALECLPTRSSPFVRWAMASTWAERCVPRSPARCQ